MPLPDRRLPLRRSLSCRLRRHRKAREVRVAAESLVDGVLNRLSRVRDLRVIPRASSGRYSVSKDRPEAFARTVHTRFLLMGTVRASPPGFRVTVRLVDTSDARTLWEQTYDRPPAELPEIERTLTSAALAQMGVSVPRAESAGAEAECGGRSHVPPWPLSLEP